MEQQSQIPESEIIKDKIRVEFKSVASEKHPDRNEDNIFIDNEKQIFGVFDGVGGIKHGEVASQNCVDQLKIDSQNVPNKITEDDARDFLAEVFFKANKKNFEEGVESTAVAGIISEENGVKSIIVANVGDSRAYLYRDGVLEQITIDDNLMSYELRYKEPIKELQSKLNNVIDPEIELNEDEQIFYNQRNIITASIGNKEVQTRFYKQDLKIGDKILFCTDGVNDNLTDNEIKEILKENNNEASLLIEKAVNVSKSNNLRSKRDDMSAIVVIC